MERHNAHPPFLLQSSLQRTQAVEEDVHPGQSTSKARENLKLLTGCSGLEERDEDSREKVLEQG